MKIKALALLACFTALSACSHQQPDFVTMTPGIDGDRSPAAAIDDGISRVANYCGYDGDLSLLEDISLNLVPDQAKLLRGYGKTLQTFLTEDGRLVLVDLSERGCDYDHLKLYQGRITKTIAIGRQLYMVVKTKESNKTGHLYMLEPDPSGDLPYRLYRVHGDNGVKFDRVSDIRAKNEDGRRQLAVFGAGGKAYAGSNGLLDVNGDGFRESHLQAQRIHDGRRISYRQRPEIHTFSPETPEIVILPRVDQSCTVQQKWKFIFGIIPWSFEERVTCY